jgi:hypothetical protein
MDANRALVEAVTALCLWLTASGCSMIGFEIGDAIEYSKPDEYVFAPDAIAGIDPNVEATAIRKDSSFVVGQVIGLDLVEHEEYSVRYASNRGNGAGESALPSLGDTILVFSDAQSGDQPHRAQFIGFDPGIVCVRGSTSDEIVWIKARLVDSITVFNGASIPGTDLERRMKTGEIPYMSRITLATEDRVVVIPLDSLAEIRQKSLKRGKWIGAAIGLTLDAIAISVLINNSERMLPRLKMNW